VIHVPACPDYRVDVCEERLRWRSGSGLRVRRWRKRGFLGEYLVLVERRRTEIWMTTAQTTRKANAVIAWTISTGMAGTFWKPGIGQVIDVVATLARAWISSPGHGLATVATETDATPILGRSSATKSERTVYAELLIHATLHHRRKVWPSGTKFAPT